MQDRVLKFRQASLGEGEGKRSSVVLQSWLGDGVGVGREVEQ